MPKFISNIWTSWRTTLNGGVEGVGLLGVGHYLSLDPHTMKLALVLAAWRVIKGALTQDTVKLVQDAAAGVAQP